jgi:hypothetical protein
LTATTTLGGKAGGAPAARLLLQALEPEEAEPFAPFTDNLARGIEAGCDAIIGESLSGQQHDLGSNDISIR